MPIMERWRNNEEFPLVFKKWCKKLDEKVKVDEISNVESAKVRKMGWFKLFLRSYSDTNNYKDNSP